MWNKAYGLETANSKGIPSPFIETSVRPQHLTETKCERICTRKREITFAHFNPPVSPMLPNKSLRLCTVVRKRSRVMYTEGGGAGGEVKKEIKENIWQGDLQLWRNVSTVAPAEAAAVSVLNRRSDSIGRVAGRRRGGTPQNGFTTLVIRSK